MDGWHSCVLLTTRRCATRRFFVRALRHGPAPVEVATDPAGPNLRVLDELVPIGAHVTEQYRSAAGIAADHAFVPNVRRGHCQLATQASTPLPARGGIHRARTDHVTGISPAPTLAPSPPGRNRPAWRR